MLLDRVDDPLIQTLFALSPPITTAEVFLDKTPEQLAQLCGASLEAVRRLRFTVARECLPARKCGPPSTGLFDTFAELRTFYRENGAVVSTGAVAVDNILERSIACLEVTEIVGHSLPYFTTHHDLADRQKAKKEGTEKSSDMQWGDDLTTTTQELMTN